MASSLLPSEVLRRGNDNQPTVPGRRYPSSPPLTPADIPS